jgi:hypothetical protein
VEDDDDLSWIAFVSAQIKESIHRTMLASIAGYYDQELERVEKEERRRKKDNLEPETPGLDSGWKKIKMTSDNEEIKIVNIKGEQLMKQFGCGPSEQILNCKMTIYSSKLFRDVLKSYFDKVDFANSLDIIKNGEKIKKMSQ